MVIMKKNLKILFAILFICLLCMFTSIPVGAVIIGNDAEPDSGSGSASDPYIYSVDSLSKVTWKHLQANSSSGTYDLYQIYENGILQYSWFFDPESCSNAEGPYFLGITRYTVSADAGLPGGSSDESLYFSFALKRDFPGKVKITLYVGDDFADGTNLYLVYYGGYDSTVVHGESPLIDTDEIYDCTGAEQIASGIVVSGGYVQFYVRHGGNYYLSSNVSDSEESSGSDSSESISSSVSSSAQSTGVISYESSATSGTDSESSISSEADNSTSSDAVSDETETAVYDDEVSIGVIGELFSSGIAEYIADYLSMETTDTVTQGDLNSIKKLYLSDLGLDSLEELEQYYFGGLESLTASGNNIEEIPNLQAPMITYLDMSDNNISDISGLLSMLTLEKINLSDNNISNIIDISSFENLLTLDLSNNNISYWGAGIKNETLRYLNLTGNPIEEDNIDTSGITALEEIELSDEKSLSDASYSEDEILSGKYNTLVGIMTISSITMIVFGYRNIISTLIRKKY